jgi:hypothetical protein
MAISLEVVEERAVVCAAEVAEEIAVALVGGIDDA